jgi:hypothetical protein
VTRAIAIALALAAGCKLDTKYGGTTYQCGVPERCPGGFVCVDGLCLEEEPGDGDGGAGPLDAAAGARVGGDVLFLTFDDRDQPLLWDRSGHRHDAHQGGSSPATGRYGGGLELDTSDSVLLSDTPDFFTGSAITIEAWINRAAGGVERGIFGDRALSDDVAAEASLEIDAQDHLVFVTNHNCSQDATRRATSTGTVPVGDWVHVAVAWDGALARFYLDGEDAGEEELQADPCEVQRFHRVGRRGGDASNASLAGVIDEVKVSSVAKTQDDIRASMELDSTELVSTCGDGIVEDEDCEPGACCNEACETSDDGVACFTGGTCASGSCEVPGGRVTDGLIALYDFQEGSGTVVGDSSGAVPAIDLAITTPGAVSWIESGLDIIGNATIEAAVATTRLATACAATDEVTLELWITPESDTAFGKIAYLSDGSSELDIGIMQIGSAYIARIRSDLTGTDGVPAIDSADGDAAERLTHVVVTRSDPGERRVYVDGRLRSTSVASGELDWIERELVIADQANDDDSWFGTYHLMAMYDRALTPTEVARNFAAGPP